MCIFIIIYIIIILVLDVNCIIIIGIITGIAIIVVFVGSNAKMLYLKLF